MITKGDTPKSDKSPLKWTPNFSSRCAPYLRVVFFKAFPRFTNATPHTAKTRCFATAQPASMRSLKRRRQRVWPCWAKQPSSCEWEPINLGVRGWWWCLGWWYSLHKAARGEVEIWVGILNFHRYNVDASEIRRSKPPGMVLKPVVN